MSMESIAAQLSAEIAALDWTQWWIMCIGLAGTMLSQGRTFNARKWGPIMGLIAQPAWFYTTYLNEQWGIFLISFVYTTNYIRGAYWKWFKGEG